MFYMYIRLTKSKKSKHPTMQIVEGVREGKKVKQKIIASLGVVKGIDDLKKLKSLTEHLIQKLEKEGLPPDNRVCIEDLLHRDTVYDGFGLVVNRLMNLTEFSNVMRQVQGRHEFDVEEIVRLILVQRWDLPGSKLRTFERQEDHGFANIDLQYIYRTMDAIEPLTDDLQKKALEVVLKYSDKPLDCFFFDVTTLYFESVAQDEIKDFGFSKDQKFHQVQIVLALVVNAEGIPLAYETFKGNLAETKTLIPVLESLKNRFLIRNVTVVCDRGLASKPNIEALQNGGFQFVVASKLRAMSKTLHINDLKVYEPLSGQETIPEDKRVFFRTMDHPQYSNTLLISTYSPKRAQKDKEDRERLLEKLRKKISEDASETSVKKTISNSGYKKFTTVKKGSSITLNEAAIKKDEEWDGFHGIAVSKNAGLTVREALARYKDLWHVEETFRIAKSTLKTRPIFHWAPYRIKSHVLICFISLFMERFLEMLLRRNNTPSTPDKIRYALSQVHKMIFEDQKTNKVGELPSSLTEDAINIFKLLEISTSRVASI